MGNNKSSLRDLRDQLASHADVIWDLVQCMSPDYLQRSSDYRAVKGREAIAALGR